MKDEIVLKMGTGTILDALNVRSIPRLRFVRPRAREILQYFEQKVRPLRAQMETHLAESRTLAILRDMLLPKLISGELRVRDGRQDTRRRYGVRTMADCARPALDTTARRCRTHRDSWPPRRLTVDRLAQSEVACVPRESW